MQLTQDVFLHLYRCSGSDGNPGHWREEIAKIAKLCVVRTKVVAPLRDTVRFIHNEVCQKTDNSTHAHTSDHNSVVNKLPLGARMRKKTGAENSNEDGSKDHTIKTLLQKSTICVVSSTVHDALLKNQTRKGMGRRQMFANELSRLTYIETKQKQKKTPTKHQNNSTSESRDAAMNERSQLMVLSRFLLSALSHTTHSHWQSTEYNGKGVKPYRRSCKLRKTARKLSVATSSGVT